MNETPPKVNDRPWLFKPGQSGNPKGGVKGLVRFHTTLNQLLERKIDFNDVLAKDGKQRMTVLEAICLRLMKEALNGNMRAIEFIIERIEGKTPDVTFNLNADLMPDEQKLKVVEAFTAMVKERTIKELQESDIT